MYFLDQELVRFLWSLLLHPLPFASLIVLANCCSCTVCLPTFSCVAFCKCSLVHPTIMASPKEICLSCGMYAYQGQCPCSCQMNCAGLHIWLSWPFRLVSIKNLESLCIDGHIRILSIRHAGCSVLLPTCPMAWMSLFRMLRWIRPTSAECLVPVDWDTIYQSQSNESSRLVRNGGNLIPEFSPKLRSDWKLQIEFK